MQTITETWSRTSDNPNEISYSKKIEVTSFWHKGQWVSGEGLREAIGDDAANRIIELHRRMREVSEIALRMHEAACKQEQRPEPENSFSSPTLEFA